MCGRAYSTYTDEELHFRYLNRKGWRWPVNSSIPSSPPNYNMCPTQLSLVLSVSDGALSFRLMRWGLVPGWAKTVKDADKYSMINAKSEEVTEKRSFKSAFQKRRCIVPVSGFYEWKRSGDSKQPYAIHLKDEPIMSLAGVWEHWESKENGEIVDSFCLMTTAANSFMREIHTRMPVILSPEQEQDWLDPEITDSSETFPLLAPCEPELLTAYPVSALVNSPKNNSPKLLEPLELSSK